MSNKSTQSDIDAQSFYKKMFNDNPSEELLEKEQKRFEQETEYDKEIQLVEQGLCKRFGVAVPEKHPNRRKDRGEGGEDLLILGQTANDRRNPKLWGIRQEDRNRHLFTLGPSGSGKSLPNRTLVLTEDGWKPIGEITIGELVYTRKGTLTQVIGVYPQEESQRIWEIELEDKRIIEASGNHLWIVYECRDGYHESVKTTQEMYEQGVFESSEKRKTPYRIVNTKPLNFAWREYDIHPYVLGCLIGSNLCNQSNSIQILSDDKDLIEKIGKKLSKPYELSRVDENHYNLRFSLTENDSIKSNNSSRFKNKIKRMGLDSHNENRFIPDEYKWGSIEQRRELLKGLMDASGTALNGHLSFSTASEKLRDDFMYLCRSLGYEVYPINNHKHNQHEYGYKRAYCVTIISDDMENILTLQRKKKSFYARKQKRESTTQEKPTASNSKKTSASNRYESFNPNDNDCEYQNNGIAITSIRPTSRFTLMTCIRVADESESYIIDGFIVTHNSTLLHAMGVEDMWYWRGGLLMEPHGDLALSLLNTAPPYRLHDIIYLNVLDPIASPGFNPLELPPNPTDGDRQEAVGAVQSLIAKHFNMDTSMSRLVKMLTTALTALSYCPGTTLLEIMDFYNNEDIRNTVLSFMPEGPSKDQITAAAMNAKPDDLGSLDNRISRFTTNRYMKHLFGQSHSTVDFFSLMNKGYYIIVPVSKGGTHDDIFLKFYGSYIVSEVYKAAVMRESIPEGDRVNFSMTLDEFQNFVSDDIEGILAEARKYGLSLSLANQYLDQLSKNIRAAVLQNCATKLVYNLGPVDAPDMARSLGFNTTANDMMNIPKYHVMAAPLIKGGQCKPFISAVFPPITVKSRVSAITADLISEISRNRFMTNRNQIEHDIEDRKERLASGNKDAVIELMTKK